jgi:Tol biopolymer transport system component
MNFVLLSRLTPVLATVTLAGLVATPAFATTAGTNGKILWAREAGPVAQLWTMNPDGSGQARVFDSRVQQGADAAWSTVDPNLVLFTAATATPPRRNILATDVRVQGLIQLTNNRGINTDPTYSPDGTRIAFTSNKAFRQARVGRPQPPTEIYIMNADGTGQRRLTTDRFISEDPDFSPDGTRIVFDETRVRNGVVQRRLATVNAAGGGYRALGRFRAGGGTNPKWMPDGQRIVFEVDTTTLSDISIMNADGTGQRTIIGTRAWETNPVPSPDGTRIAFTSDRNRRGARRLGRGFEVYTMNLDGTGITRLTNNRVPDLFPDWQRLP